MSHLTSACLPTQAAGFAGVARLPLPPPPVAGVQPWPLIKRLLALGVYAADVTFFWAAAEWLPRVSRAHAAAQHMQIWTAVGTTCHACHPTHAAALGGDGQCGAAQHACAV